VVPGKQCQAADLRQGRGRVGRSQVVLGAGIDGSWKGRGGGCRQQE
jgi:hypothetical protein